LTEEAIAEKDLILRYSHDDTFELYVNGKLLVKTGFEWNKNVEIVIPDSIVETITDGKVTIAAHCNNRYGGGLVDFGLYAKHKSVAFLSKAALQKSVDVQATQTHYVFECGDVELKLTFTSPFLPDDLELIGRPVNYISYEVTSLDEDEHQVEMYFEATPQWVSNKAKATTQSTCYEKDGMVFARTGVLEQQILDRDGNGWGYFYLATGKQNSVSAIGNSTALRKSFFEKGCFLGNPESATNADIALCQSFGKAKNASGKILSGYDEAVAVQYFGDNLPPYWNRRGDKAIEQVLEKANRSFRSLHKKCNRFDYDLMVKARKAGGKRYAELCALAYRQAVASHQLVESPDKDLLFFSQGMAVVDVSFADLQRFLI
jgi:hypothetical protein